MKIFIFLLLMTNFSLFAVTTGQEAPNFTLPGLEKSIELKNFRGKTVVLEWLNHGCPFVKKHYSSGNMQGLQKESTDQGIVWLSIISSAPGKQGHVNPKEALADKKAHNSNATDILLDPQGKVGRLYGAKTTPHMFIINPKGVLVYQGAIDDKADTDTGSIPGSKNYVREALKELKSNKPISVAQTKSYGCSVKYE